MAGQSACHAGEPVAREMLVPPASQLRKKKPHGLNSLRLLSG